MTNIPRSLSAFAAWLPRQRTTGDDARSDVSVRHQVARYCDFLGTQVSLGADPLADGDARDRAVDAYRSYLEVFNTAATPVSASLESVDRFYVFLGLGPVREASPGR
jgi:hypothetical protein